MEKIRAAITGINAWVPEYRLDNHEISKMVDTSDEWITTRTGIKERRIAAKNETTSDLAAKAACQALDDAGIKPSELELIVVATVTPGRTVGSGALLGPAPKSGVCRKPHKANEP